VSIRIHPENALSPKTPRRLPWAGMRKDDNPLSDFETVPGAIFAQNEQKSFQMGKIPALVLLFANWPHNQPTQT
jgi:hypothetical protein